MCACVCVCVWYGILSTLPVYLLYVNALVSIYHFPSSTTLPSHSLETSVGRPSHGKYGQLRQALVFVNAAARRTATLPRYYSTAILYYSTVARSLTASPLPSLPLSGSTRLIEPLLSLCYLFGHGGDGGGRAIKRGRTRAGDEGRRSKVEDRDGTLIKLISSLLGPCIPISPSEAGGTDILPAGFAR